MSKTSKIKLEKQEKGWILLPINGEMELLDVLYGGSYFSLDEEDRFFEKEKESQSIQEYLMEIAEGCKISIAFKKDGIIELEDERPIISFYEVDFKWSLWTLDEDVWDIQMLNELKEAFLNERKEVTIYTAPWKEIRYGKVTVKKNEAIVEFYAVWDEPYQLVPMDCPEEKTDIFKDEIINYFMDGEGFYDDENPIGASVYKEITAQTFEELMELIDEAENELIKQEKENSKHFYKFLEVILKEI